MSMCAILPVASLISANDSLELAGFGPNNFSVPSYIGAGAQGDGSGNNAWEPGVFGWTQI